MSVYINNQIMIKNTGILENYALMHCHIIHSPLRLTGSQRRDKKHRDQGWGPRKKDRLISVSYGAARTQVVPSPTPLRPRSAPPLSNMGATRSSRSHQHPDLILAEPHFLFRSLLFTVLLSEILFIYLYVKWVRGRACASVWKWDRVLMLM